ncbi:urea transporter [Paraburkholderia hayleyella]|uniref:urea transporter n=1 Tax=Paraburkholderia hayleyella TaxID=2152889 RepID=UPI001292181F|nr:urea transporter [Paraburkholderia hayleyella]
MPAAVSRKTLIGLRTLLRSFGQLVLQGNAATGACVFAAWLAYSPRLACAGLLGALAANAAALRLNRFAWRDTYRGLHGFNGALAAVVVFTFIADNARAISFALPSALATTWLLKPWARWLRSQGLKFYSSPALLVSGLWLPLINLSNPTVQRATAHSTALLHDAGNWLSGLAQTSFACGAWPGLLILAGIAAASRRHAFWALAGTVLGSTAHLLLGASVVSFDLGLLGFNGALTALALANSGALAALSGIALAVVLQRLADHCGLVTLGVPFVLATWSVLWLGQHALKPAWARFLGLSWQRVRRFSRRPAR